MAERRIPSARRFFVPGELSKKGELYTKGRGASVPVALREGRAVDVQKRSIENEHWEARMDRCRVLRETKGLYSTIYRAGRH